MKSALALALAGCGGAAAPAPAPVGNATTLTGEVDVYAWNGEALAGLYCYTAGVLRVDGCRFVERHEADALLVITSDDGVSVWTGRREDAPVLGDDTSGVERFALPNLNPVGRSKAHVPAGDPSQPTYDVMGYHALGLAALDLDRDGVAEVIYVSDDDGGIFAEAAELGHDDGFRARIPDVALDEM